MYLDRLQTAKPIGEQVKGMSDGQLESYFANLGKRRAPAPPRQTNNDIPTYFVKQ